jgi:hypothetical protein
MEERLPKSALQLTPPGKRRGRPTYKNKTYNSRRKAKV